MTRRCKHNGRVMPTAACCMLVTVVIVLGVPALCRGLDAHVEGRTQERDEHHEFKIALRFIEEKRFDDAIRILEGLCLDYPEFDLAAEHLARCYIETGQIERAVAFLEGRLERAPGHFPFARDLGHICLDRGERDRALAVWHGILEHDPDEARNYGRVARLEVEAGLYEEAIATYRAGRVFEKLHEPYTYEIIRLERLLGRREAAFREAIDLLASSEKLNMRSAVIAAKIGGEAGFDEQLIAIVDSVSESCRPVDGRFHVARAAILIEAGRYDDAWSCLEEQSVLSAKQSYDFISYLSSVRWRKTGPGLAMLYRKVLDAFLARYPQSPVAPGVMLSLAENLREEAAGADSEKLARALRVADEAVEHRWGKVYGEKVALFKALLLLEDLNRPHEALDALGKVRFEGIGHVREAAEIRMRALVLAGPRSEPELEALAADADSIVSAIGRYGIGRMRFIRGDYEGAVEGLSSLAESCPWSPWANDALETAMLVAEALREGRGALDCYRAALSSEAEGRTATAADSLDALVSRYPSSVLRPRAVYMRAELDLRQGRVERAAAGFGALAEQFPLDRLAPRALERAAGIAADGAREDALRLYEQILERYPDDPFLERVRRRYVALREAMEGDGNAD